MTERYKACDKLLVRGCVKRDLEAWNALVAKYSSLMRASAKKRLARHGFYSVPGEDVEDMVQDALTGLWRDEKISSIQNPESLPYWLSMIAQNSAVTYLRKIKREGILETMPEPDIENNSDIIDQLLQHDSSPRKELHKNELRKAIDTAIASLPANEKLVMKLSLFQGKKHHEIAIILNMPQGSVSCLAKRAKLKLQAALKSFLIFFVFILPFLASYIVGGQK
jgi:RNA polymerase sigma factor (sigma-70 family)